MGTIDKFRELPLHPTVSEIAKAVGVSIPTYRRRYLTDPKHPKPLDNYPHMKFKLSELEKYFL